MPVRAARFRVRGLAPATDPAWRAAGLHVRSAFMNAALAYVLKAKDQELAAGLDKDGVPLIPIRPGTKRHRISRMGPADPSAPPLMPAYATSRTRLWLTAKVVDGTAIEVSWRNDWGDVLLHHAQGGRALPRRDVIGTSRALPRRDVIGISQASLTKARGWALGWWIHYTRTGQFLARNVPATGGFKPLPVTGRTDFENFTYGIGTTGSQEAEVARARMLLAQGRTTGFRSRRPGQGLPAIGGPGTLGPPRFGGGGQGPLPPPVVPKPPGPKPRPLRPEEYPAVRSLGGSTGATLVRDDAGREFVKKAGASEGHLREEAAADAIYRAVGVAVPESRVYETKDGPFKLANFVEGVSLAELERTDPKRYAAAVKDLKKGFAADALLGNWDVVGLNADNVIVTPAGKVYRIDNGGSLRYRAQGEPKGANWSAEVGEIVSLRDPAINATAAKVFGGLTDAQVRSQVLSLYKKKATILSAAPEELKKTIADRLEGMKAWADAAAPRQWKPSPASKFKAVPEGQEDDWGSRHFAGWNESLSTRERDAIREYSGSGHLWMNSILRTGDYSDATSEGITQGSALRTIADATRALNRGKTPTPIKVSRAIYDLGTIGIDPDKVKIGDKITFKGFLSTSIKGNSDFAGDVRLELRLPAGTPGGYVNAIGNTFHPNEKEFLLPPGASTFRLVKLTRRGQVTEIILEWVNP